METVNGKFASACISVSKRIVRDLVFPQTHARLAQTDAARLCAHDRRRRLTLHVKNKQTLTQGGW